MNYQFTIPETFPQMTVKELLEDYFLIPRKIRHFLRTKKHVLVNGETINWQSPVQKGDQIQLIFDPSGEKRGCVSYPPLPSVILRVMPEARS